MADDNDDNGPSEQEMAMRKAIMAIMMDTTLTDAEKSQKRQQLMCGGWKTSKEEDKPAKGARHLLPVQNPPRSQQLSAAAECDDCIIHCSQMILPSRPKAAARVARQTCWRTPSSVSSVLACASAQSR